MQESTITTEEYFNDLDRAITESNQQPMPVQTTLTWADWHRFTGLMSELTSSIHLEKLLQRVIEEAMAVTHAERGFMVLLNDRHEKVLMVASGVEQTRLESALDGTSSTVIRRLFELRSPLLVENVASHDSLARQQSIVTAGICSILGTPLIIRDRVIGVAYVDTTQPTKAFTSREQDLFAALGGIAAIAIENARLFSTLDQTSKSLQDTTDLLDNMLKSMPLGVLVFGPDSNLQYANAVVRKHFWTGGEDRFPMRCLDLPFFRTSTGADLIECASRNDFLSMPQEGLEIIDGARIYFYLFEVPRRGEQRLFGLLLADRTKEHQLEQEIIRSGKFQLVSQLAGGIAHEINNALTPAFGALDLAKYRVKEAPATLQTALSAAVNLAQQQLNKTREIVQDLRNLSRPKPPRMEKVDLNEVANNSVLLLRSSTGRLKQFSDSDPTAPLRIRLKSAELPAFIQGDLGQLEGMLFNLIINAAQAVEDKGEGEVSISVTQTANDVTLEVSDEGVGIPQDKVGRIFEPYYSTKGEERGTGLGLTIVEMAATAHRSKISVSSELNQGTTFTVKFPAYRE